VPANRRSRLITAGVARSPNRAMLRAVGFGDADFEKPIVGVANGHSTMNPCNAGIQPLVRDELPRIVPAEQDAGEIGEAVPAHGDRADLHGNGVDGGKGNGEHGSGETWGGGHSRAP